MTAIEISYRLHLLADRAEHATVGTRRAVALVLEDVAAYGAADRAAREYWTGRAAGLLRRSRSRADRQPRAMEMH